MIRSYTIKNWQEKLLQDGYAPGLVNAFLSVANAYLDYIGHGKYQLAGRFKEERAPQPELSRVEYLHLLRMAKALEKEQAMEGYWSRNNSQTFDDAEMRRLCPTF